jgi:hypothetical protein
MIDALETAYDLVADEQTFLRFVEALAEDRRTAVRLEAERKSSPFGPDAGGWENTTIEDFLGAGLAWAEDTQFGTSMTFKELELSDASPWKRMAAFLMAARVYE